MQDGSEENYLLLAKHKLKRLYEAQSVDYEQGAKHTDWFKDDQLEYDKKKDVLYCTIGDEIKAIAIHFNTKAMTLEQIRSQSNYLSQSIGKTKKVVHYRTTF